MAPNLNDVAYGLTSTGVKVALRVDADGVVATSGGGGGGGGSGDASAANQTTEITKLTAIDGHVDGLEASATSIDGKTPALGQALAAASVPVVLTAAQITTLTPPAAITGFATSANQTTILADLGATNETSAAADNSTSGLNGLIKRLLASVTLLRAQLPAALGSNTAANSLPVTLSTDGPFPTLTGAVTETAPATDTASSGLNGRLQRIAQRLTSLIALLPTALGSTTASASFPVTLSSDGPFSTLTGAVTETAPASDTASSGVNGRLQRIAQRLTTLIAGITVSSITLPTVIYNGQKAVTTAGTRVTLAASQAILSGVTIKAKATNTGLIYVGDGSVSSTTGFILAAGDTVFLEIANLNTVNIDSSVSGEGVSFLAS